jgi:hypothetical protein
MSDNWAAENLQTIRTLMERTAVYRRALAPITLTTGIMGAAAGGIGWAWSPQTARGIIFFWLATAVATLLIGLVMVRRQAMRAAEPFWSPPTRRVAQAFLPCLYIGLVAGVALTAVDVNLVHLWVLVSVWLALYGSALLASSFFMSRSVKAVGLFFLALGSALLAGLILTENHPAPRFIHAVMGATFGGVHLAYGAYLWFTEKKPATP